MRFNLTLLSKQIFTPKTSNKYFSQFLLNQYPAITTREIDNFLLKKPAAYILRRNFSDTKNSSCWKCKSNNTERLFCKNCGALQKIDKNINYFSILGLKNSFKIDPVELTKKFRELQGFVHPDKFSNRSDDEQEISSEWSSILNKAYKTLSVPIKRGEYVLEQNGISLPQDNSVLDKEFLLEMMDRNEEIEEACTIKEIFQLLDKVRKELEDNSVLLEDSLEKNDLEQGTSIIIKMKYLTSLESSIKDKATFLGAIQ